MVLEDGETKNNVAFVIGPPSSGKLTFAKRHLPEYHVVDLHDIQQHGVSTWESYEIAQDRLIEALQAGDKVVLRHTLLKAPRRLMYVDAVKQVLGEDARISCYYSLPDIDTYIQYDKADLKEYLVKHPDKVAWPENREYLGSLLEFFDVPTCAEGFDEVWHIQSMVDGMPMES